MTRNAKAALILILGVLTLPSIARAAGSATDVSLSSQATARADGVSAPIISAPSSVNAFADQSLTIQADATDSDAGDVLTITQTGAPASLTFSHSPSVSPAMATLSGTPGSGDVGAHSIEWQVTDGTSTASATTALVVAANTDPTITAPSPYNTAETVHANFSVLASDADGDVFTSMTSTALPAGATFTANAVNSAGIFDWIPAIGQAGDYTVTFTVESGSPTRSASVTSMIHVGPLDRRPVVTAPGTVNTIPDILVTVNITATDPDGDAINSLTAGGTQNTPLPAGAVFTPNASNSAGALTWTPTVAQIGNYGIEWRAFSGALNLQNALTVTRIIVRDRAPVVTAPASVTIAEGALLTVNVTATDPDASPIASLTAAPLPLGATFTSNAAHTAGTLTWTPDYSSAGSYPVMFTAMNALTGSATTNIVVTNTNRAPTANAGGPYTGFEGIPVAFTGSGSTDPDGDALTYAWDFGDANTGVGATPSHAYASAGMYNVALRVTDTGSLFGDGATTAHIVDVFAAYAFPQGNSKIKLNAGKPQYCFEIQPIDAAYNNTDVDLASIVMISTGTGAVDHISAAGSRTAATGDLNLDGIQEIKACFNKNDLKSLFSGLGDGNNTITVSLEGNLFTGGKFHSEMEVVVSGVSGGGALSATVSPNPFNPEGTLSFVTKQPGPVRVRLYDSSGRLVRTLADESFAAPGYHELRINGRNDSGMKLASGVYFYKLETADGRIVGSVSILK